MSYGAWALTFVNIISVFSLSPNVDKRITGIYTVNKCILYFLKLYILQVYLQGITKHTKKISQTLITKEHWKCLPRLQQRVWDALLLLCQQLGGPQSDIYNPPHACKEKKILMQYCIE